MKTDADFSNAATRRDLTECPGPAHPFLAAMEAEQAKQLLDHAEIVHFKPGEIIFREGEPADRFFLVEAGAVVLETRANGHGLVHIDTVQSGDVFGWSWLFPPFAWHFQARALEPTRAIVCSGGRLLVLCEEKPDFGYDLMKRIAQLLIHRLQATRKHLGAVQRGVKPPVPPAGLH